MSDQDSVLFSCEKICTRTRGNPTPNKVRVRAYRARKLQTHKRLRVFIRPEVKDMLLKLCEDEEITQSEMIELLIHAEFRRSRRRSLGEARLKVMNK